MGDEAQRKLFGTDGIRGKAGVYPLDQRTVEHIGRALVENMRRTLGHTPAIVIGRDTRESGPAIQHWLTAGARAAGATVESAGVITTPGVAYITRAIPFDAGVVISASHNPFQDNGIKVFSRSGKKLDDETEKQIEADLLAGVAEAVSATAAAEGEAGDLPDADISELRYREQYINYLVNEVGNGLSLGYVRIGLDCANGAASDIAPRVFERLGAQVSVLHASPDGRNINEKCGSLHTGDLSKLVVSEGLDLGIAFDGDADRALFIDGRGSLVDGDHTLLIVADYLKGEGKLDGNRVVATVMSNIGLEIALRERSIEMSRAPVGDRYVLEELIACGAKLGGEQSGHIIFPDIALAGDGIVTATLLLRAISESGHSLAHLASQLVRFPQTLVNVEVRQKPPLESIPAVREEMDRVSEELQGRGRLLIRYSGTENLARVMIEGEEQTQIEKQAHRLADVIRQAIG